MLLCWIAHCACWAATSHAKRGLPAYILLFACLWFASAAKHCTHIATLVSNDREGHREAREGHWEAEALPVVVSRCFALYCCSCAWIGLDAISQRRLHLLTVPHWGEHARYVGPDIERLPVVFCSLNTGVLWVMLFMLLELLVSRRDNFMVHVLFVVISFDLRVSCTLVTCHAGHNPELGHYCDQCRKSIGIDGKWMWGLQHSKRADFMSSVAMNLGFSVSLLIRLSGLRYHMASASHGFHQFSSADVLLTNFPQCSVCLIRFHTFSSGLAWVCVTCEISWIFVKLHAFESSFQLCLIRRSFGVNIEMVSLSAYSRRGFQKAWPGVVSSVFVKLHAFSLTGIGSIINDSVSHEL